MVAIDTIGSGLNPHLIADQGPVTNAVAAMTLPSPFRPVATPGGTEWMPDTSLLSSAEVTSTQPFTVTYRLNQNAQWSDGLPVTADDFSYLWRQMISQPDVIDPAGYQQITDVASRSGGKEAVVTFGGNYPAWRQLFSGLLPSHVLRGTPGGFQTGMDTGLPPSAGPFSINTIDRSRDEVRLIRNDRYWTTPSVVDKVYLRRIGDTGQLAESVRADDTGAVSITAGPALATQLGAIPGVVTGRQPDSRVLGVTVNTRTPEMSDVSIRHAILGLVDTRLLTAASAGDAVVTPFGNTLFAPTDRGYTPVNRPALSPAQALELLRSAGYAPAAASGSPRGAGAATASPENSAVASAPASPGDSPQSPAASSPTESVASSTSAVPDSDSASLPEGVARIEHDGIPLQIQVGVVAGDQRAASAAASLVDQLRSLGIESSVQSVAGSALYGTALSTSGVDLIVGWSSTAIDPATRFASRTACQPNPSGVPPTTPAPTTAATPTTPTAEGAAASTVPTATTTSPTAPPPGAQDSFAGNVSGLCDPVLSRIAAQAIATPDPIPSLRAAESDFAARYVYLPVYQDSLFTLAGSTVVGVPRTGPVQTGIFGTAATWNVKADK